MSKERELLKKVLEGEANGDFFISFELENEVIELLAQPELSTDSLHLDTQEPVAWVNDSGGCFLSDGNKYSENWTPLYTSPQKPEPLSDKDIGKGFMNP